MTSLNVSWYQMGRLFADDTNLTYADNDLNKITSLLNPRPILSLDIYMI